MGDRAVGLSGSTPAGGRPPQGAGLPALDARRTRSVARITRRGTRSEASTASTSKRAISRPISSIGCADAGQLGCGAGRDRRVVEADDGDIGRDPPARGGQDGQRAGGHQVGRGEDGIDVGASGQEPLHRGGAALLGEVADRLEVRVGREAALGEGVAIAAQAIDARRPCPAGR